MDHQSTITPRDLECMLSDETIEPKALPLSLLEEITNSFSDEQQLGTGGFAVVYKGLLENGAVAVKRMYKPYMHEKEFQQEFECLMMVTHHNIVRFLGYCADTQGIAQRHEGKIILADVPKRLLCFECLPNGSLYEYITDTVSKLRWRDCYQVIMGICQGLHYLHQKNIVHLDLKPENILLNDNWVPKIIDFGISRHFHETQSQVITTTIVGTIGYMAPECFEHTKGTPLNPYRLDIYSLGVVILEVLTGKKVCDDVDMVVERWSDMLGESMSKAQLKQVRVCAEIGIECSNFDHAKRLNSHQILNKLKETESICRHMETGVLGSHEIKPDMLIGTRHALWLRYQQLNLDIRRCIEYCSIFPKGCVLRRVELVHLWIAQGFVKASCATEDIEDVAEGYIQELVSCSFLQPTEVHDPTETDSLFQQSSEVCDPIEIDSFTIDDVLHDLLDKVTVNIFRIENARSQIREYWEGEVPRDTQHLFIQNYDEELIYEEILELENILTLIIYDVTDEKPISESVIKHICKRLPRLRVLGVAFSKGGCPTKELDRFSVPESIQQLKQLRYFAFKANPSCILSLPRTLRKLHHIQVLDFGDASILQFTVELGDSSNMQFSVDGLVNLRHIICKEDMACPRNIGRSTSLQTIPWFSVSDEQGHEIRQLRCLNKLRGSLQIMSLHNVKSKEEALEANLAAKGRLTELTLLWFSSRETARLSPEVEAEVLEGMCPPVGLKTLAIWGYKGSRYPDWMVGKQNGGPKDLQELNICTRGKGPIPQIVEAFPHLRVLRLVGGDWDGLPGNMEQLTSLKILHICLCKKIRSLPSLPQSLEEFDLSLCNHKFMKSCIRVRHPNWQKIEHIPKKAIHILSLMERLMVPFMVRFMLDRHIGVPVD